MAQISRRKMLAAGLAAAASPALAARPPDGPAEIDALLRKKLDAAQKEKVAASLRAMAGYSKAREAFPLPEGSEPCTVYVPVPAPPRKAK
jgi:hypothetical protein